MREILPDMRTKYSQNAFLHNRNLNTPLPVRAVRLNIPMPGHPVGEAQKQQVSLYFITAFRFHLILFFPAQTLADIQTLKDLIADHDVILLLTDTST